MPVLSGVRAELVGNALQLTGSDTDLTIHVSQVTVNGEEDGVTVLPGRLAADIVRALPPGACRSRSATTRPTSPPAAPSSRSACCRPRSTRACRSPPATRSRSPAAELAAALRQVVPAASSDDARPILTGVLLAAEAGGLRLVATDSYRLAVRDLPGTSVLAEGQSVLVPSRALAELGACCRAPDRSSCASASATRRSKWEPSASPPA